MRSYKAEGIVIKRKNFGEADRFLTVFTKQYGKISIKAKGVRKISSRRGAHVELLNLVDMNLYKGHSLPILTEAQSVNNFPMLKADLRSVGIAYHLCELVDSLCPENQENFKVFILLLETLLKLEEKDEAPRIVEKFERELLLSLGFMSSKQDEFFDTSGFIEEILERRLRAKRLFPLFV